MNGQMPEGNTMAREKPDRSSWEPQNKISLFFANPKYCHNNPVSDRWRNGSAFDSRSKGYPFKSGVVHI